MLSKFLIIIFMILFSINVWAESTIKLSAIEEAFKLSDNVLVLIKKN